MSTERVGTVQSAVNELIRVLTKCTDAQFGERINIILQLCQIWSNGEDVDLRCNEPEITSTNEVVKSDCCESQSLTTDCTRKTKPIAKYKAPVFPRRKPGEIAVPFDCTVCGKSFQFYSQLEQHSRYHTGVRPYECNVCGQSFALQCSLLKHTTIHTGEKPLMCDTCGQRFSHVNYLKAHQKTHFRDQRYSCQECDRKFTTAGSLRHHITTNHCAVQQNGETDERFTCDKCGKTFASMALVRCHLLVHADDESVDNIGLHINGSSALADYGLESDACGFCGKSFKTLEKLRRHMAVHCGEKQHECAVCGRRFFQLSNLNAHMRAHSFRDDVPFTHDVMSTMTVSDDVVYDVMLKPGNK